MKTHRWLKRARTLALAGLLGAPIGWMTPATGATLAGTQVQWVAPGGTDTGNSCRQAAHPCATIAHALADAASRHLINLAAGTFHEHGLTVTAAVTIDGAGAARTFIDGDSRGQVMLVQAGAALTLQGLTIEKGKSPAHAGAVENSGTLALRHVRLIGNSAADPGGAVVNYATITALIDDQFISNRSARYGGAIENFGTIWAADGDLFAHNFADIGAGAIDNDGTITSLTDSTFRTNIAEYAGALDNTAMIGDLSRDTFWDNQVDGYGGGLVNVQGAIDTVTDDTFVANTAIDDLSEGGAIEQDGGTIGLLADDTIIGNHATFGGGINNTGSSDIKAVTGLILAANTGTQGPNCYNFLSTFGDAGYNLQSDSDTSCGLSAAHHDLIGVSPQLRQLGNYGGPTDTAPPEAGSPVVDHGPAGACPTITDQRGALRPQGAACDIGAVELSPPVLNRVTPAQGPSTGGTRVQIVGSGFTLTTGLTFGPTPVRFHVVSDRDIEVVSPPGHGAETVRVTTPDGRSPATVTFTY